MSKALGVDDFDNDDRDNKDNDDLPSIVFSFSLYDIVITSPYFLFLKNSLLFFLYDIYFGIHIYQSHKQTLR